MEDTEAMNKTFASKITVTASYLKEELIPPTVDLELAVCENNIIARGTGKANAEKQISKYEFQLDDQEWASNDMESIKRFTDLETGNHTIKFRVTDDKGVTNETLRTVEVNYKEPTLATIGGKTISLVTEGNGLYKVSHCDVTGTMDDLGFSQEEYRYAGIDYDEIRQPTDYVHNYVTFNDEKWRIIGLVNVKTSDETIEQRLKIIRDDSIGNYSFDHKPKGTGSSIDEFGSNDWTDSQLMEMLNGIYYESAEDGKCWIGPSGDASSEHTCTFDGKDGGVKGLNDDSHKMIDESIIWNLGGSLTYEDVTVDMFYNRERGETVYKGSEELLWDRPTEWKKDNTRKPATSSVQSKLDSSLFHSIALPYASDYGYATSGGTLGREKCLQKEMFNWKNLDGENDQTQCAENDWLKPTSGSIWLLLPDASNNNRGIGVYLAPAGASVMHVIFILHYIFQHLFKL